MPSAKPEIFALAFAEKNARPTLVVDPGRARLGLRYPHHRDLGDRVHAVWRLGIDHVLEVDVEGVADRHARLLHGDRRQPR
jgi:hypothetical protein